MTHLEQLSTKAHAGPAIPAAGHDPLPARLVTLGVRSFGLTDKGRKRETNQDQFVTATLMRALHVEQSSLVQSAMHYGQDCGHLFVVADGVGGAAGGEKASELAVSTVEELMLNALHWLITLDATSAPAVLDDFKHAIRAADASIYAAAQSTPGLKGMGTTLTMAYSIGTEAYFAHVGDSRCYLLHHGQLHQVTRDHTLVQEMIDHGVLRPSQADEHQFRHVITNAVGGSTPGVHVEVGRIQLERGDTLILCTDGLTGMIPDARITEVLVTGCAPQQACEQLSRLANEAGGVDNITVIVARFE